MVVLGIFLSQFEAVGTASMLRGYGIFVSLDGEHYTSAIYQSVGYGGYRLRVRAEDHAAASDILRECGAAERELYRTTPRPALLWFVAFWGGLHAVTGFLAGGPGLAVLAGVWGSLGIPVDPKGRADYFLSAPADQAF